MSKIVCLPFAELGREECVAWTNLLHESPALQNPFLTPDFAAAVAQVRSDVEVGVIEDSKGLAGVFPFQRTRPHEAFPVGSALSNRQALIVKPRTVLSPHKLLEACWLNTWNFHQLVDPNGYFQADTWQRRDCLYADLSQGFEAYRTQQGKKTGRFAKLNNRIRKIERELGPLQFELNTKDVSVLNCMIEWKSQQYQRTNHADPFAFAWVKKLLALILEQSSEQLNPKLSAVYAGKHLVAVAYDLRYGANTEAWFTAFNPEYAVFGPGLILLHEKLRSCADDGRCFYCFGPGDDDYKKRFQTDAIPVYKGAACRHLLPRIVRRSGHYTKQWMRTSAICSWANRGIDALRAAKRRRDMK